ncbi:MAG: sulfotransferase [Deltaproteobacteria bacterium]|nr:sulfotransferase [Deltaproteobacteria bacterium]
MGDSVGGAARMVSLDVDELVGLARKSTGLSEFGSFDGDWRGRLESLVAGIESGANLNVVGRLMTRQEILRSLRTRLMITRRLDEQPKILDEKIVAPIIVTGQGRSGTTILFELLSLDPKARSISATDAAHPIPGFPVATPADRAKLIAMTECEQEFWADVQPEFATIHELRSDLPVECIHATMPSFASFIWWMMSDVPSWTPDFVAAMTFHKVFLQMMQYGKPEATWILKTPVYLPILDLVFAVYPDAWILLTHRDPLKTVPSGLSTLASCRWHRSDTVDLERIRAGGTGIFDLMVHIQQRRTKASCPPASSISTSPNRCAIRSPRSRAPIVRSAVPSRQSTRPGSATTSPPSPRTSTASTVMPPKTGATRRPRSASAPAATSTPTASRSRTERPRARPPNATRS